MTEILRWESMGFFNILDGAGKSVIFKELFLYKIVHISKEI